MEDRNIIFDAFRNCITEPKCRDCPWKSCEEFHQTKKIPLDLCLDILKLLKEQEAVEPIKMQRMDGNFSFFVPYYLCGNCKYELVGKDVMFCSHCGQAVKWE